MLLDLRYLKPLKIYSQSLFSEEFVARSTQDLSSDITSPFTRLAA